MFDSKLIFLLKKYNIRLKFITNPQDYKAYYQACDDTIYYNIVKQHESKNNYILAHELIHATGTDDRLDRWTIPKGSYKILNFRKNEECCAILGTTLLLSYLNLYTPDMDNRQIKDFAVYEIKEISDFNRQQALEAVNYLLKK